MKKMIIGLVAAIFSVTAVAASWSANRTVYGLISGSDGVAGVMTLKLGKMDKKGLVKFSGSVEFWGKKYTIKSEKFVAKDPISATLTVKKLGSAQMSVNADGTFSGTLGDYTIESNDEGDAWSEGDELIFMLDDLPDEINGWNVLSEFSPDSVNVTVGKKMKLTTPKTGSIKWDKEMEALWCPVRIDGEKVDSENPGALKLSVNKKTGKLSGSFKVYTETKSEKKAKAYTFKISGFVTGGSGIGTAYNKNAGTFGFSLQ